MIDWKSRASLILLFSFFALTLAAGLGCSSSSQTASFDKDHAFDLLKKQVDFGPRYPNVPAHAATADFIVSQLKPYADDVTTQSFDETVAGKSLDLRNIVARFNRSAKQTILLSAHWDTRPCADMEVDPAKRTKPIPGANDGASEVAVLLELARMFAKQKPDVGVIMVFFDGEDYTTYPPSTTDMFLGSKYFASHLEAKTKVTIKYGILLDMVGDKNLNIRQEVQSVQAAPDVVKKVWDAARSLGYQKSFISSQGYSISDDHLPLIKAGIKCIDVIDFDYGPWHTLDDTVDKCSPDSLKIVGDVIARVIYEEKGS